eukprot:1758333-Rhodomonas_salina.1
MLLCKPLHPPPPPTNRERNFEKTDAYARAPGISANSTGSTRSTPAARTRCGRGKCRSRWPSIRGA